MIFDVNYAKYVNKFSKERTQISCSRKYTCAHTLQPVVIKCVHQVVVATKKHKSTANMLVDCCIYALQFILANGTSTQVIGSAPYGNKKYKKSVNNIFHFIDLYSEHIIVTIHILIKE